MDDVAFADVCRLSVADLHRRCIALEDERRCLADEIVERRAAVTAERQRLIAREAAVIREIGSMLDRMQTAPVTTIDDIAALVDLVLDIEFDAPSPDVEMSWLRRQSPPGFDPETEIFAPSRRKD